MKVVSTNTFEKSFKKLINSQNWWRWEFYQEKWWALKWAIRNLRKYFKIVIKMRDFDFAYNIQMMKFQIEMLKDRIKNGWEEETSKGKKVKKMERFIELANNYLEDNYMDRCNYEPGDLQFKEPDEKGNREIYFDSPLTDEERREKIIEIRKLEDDEWNEMIDILKEARGWWD